MSDHQNWMQQLDDTLPLWSLSIPGTHDSCTQYCTFPIIFCCQNTSIAEQLEHGFRFLDIRLSFHNDQMYAVHGKSDCKTSHGQLLTFDSVVDNCLSFLKAHPGETILMSIKKDRSYPSEPEDFHRILLEKYYEVNPQSWYIQNRTPILKEARGKIVLLRRYSLFNPPIYTDQNSGLNFSIWPDQESKHSTQGLVFHMDSISGDEPQNEIFVQDRYSFPPSVKWTDCVLPVLSEACRPKMWYLNFLSTMAQGCPKRSSQSINLSFLNHPLSQGSHGVIICDFGSPQLAEKVYKTNNGVKYGNLFEKK